MIKLVNPIGMYYVNLCAPRGVWEDERLSKEEGLFLNPPEGVD